MNSFFHFTLIVFFFFWGCMKKEEDKVSNSETNSASLITASDFDTNYDSLQAVAHQVAE